MVLHPPPPDAKTKMLRAAEYRSSHNLSWSTQNMQLPLHPPTHKPPHLFEPTPPPKSTESRWNPPGFSHNQLCGQLPVTWFLTSAFQGNNYLFGSSLPPCKVQQSAPDKICKFCSSLFNMLLTSLSKMWAEIIS